MYLSLTLQASDKPACSHCNTARTQWAYPLYDMTCLGCVARHLAASPLAWKAFMERDGEPMQAAIRAAWGDRYEDGRKAVLDWIKTLRALRRP